MMTFSQPRKQCEAISHSWGAHRCENQSAIDPVSMKDADGEHRTVSLCARHRDLARKATGIYLHPTNPPPDSPGWVRPMGQIAAWTNDPLA